MAKKLDKALTSVLSTQMPITDIRDEAAMGGQHPRRYQSGLTLEPFKEKEEPMDKVMVAIQHHFINGDFDKASELFNKFRSAKRGQFFTWHHLNQLMDWVRNIYKYTNMKELSRNYYDNARREDMKIQGVEDLTKVKVGEETVAKFVKETEKVLKKKLQMR